MRLNDISICGYVGNAAADLEKMPSGISHFGFTLAATEKSKNGTEHTSWFKVNLWDKAAEYNYRQIQKGANVFVKGSIKVSQFDKRDGTKGTSVEINARYVGVIQKASTLESAPAPIPVQTAVPDFTNDDVPF